MKKCRYRREIHSNIQVMIHEKPVPTSLAALYDDAITHLENATAIIHGRRLTGLRTRDFTTANNQLRFAKIKANLLHRQLLHFQSKILKLNIKNSGALSARERITSQIREYYTRACKIYHGLAEAIRLANDALKRMNK